MKFFNLIAVFAGIVFSNVLFGQAINGPQSFDAAGDPINHPRCGSHDLMLLKDQHAAGYLEQSNVMIQSIVANSNQEKQNNGYDERFIVPVVFHVVYNNAGENIPDSVIFDQMEVLNECFRRQNADAVNTRTEFLSLVGDAQIEFVLADTDPLGNPTDGIVRTATTIENFGGILPYAPGQNAEISQWVNDSLFPNYYRITETANGGSDAWDTSRYLNVWLGDMRIFEPQFNNLEELVYFALASAPEGHPNWPTNILTDLGITEQGVLMHYVTAGSNNPNTFPAPYTTYNNKVRDGKILVHEVGHYLGLRHIWGDGNCGVDDFIDDTPNAAAASTYNCNTNLNTCVDNINGADLPNMIENYMDYSSGSCQNAFTFGQIDVMRETLQQFRPDLWESVSLVSINENELFTDFIVYPNPTSGDVSIDFKEQKQEVSISITNNLGQLVASEFFTGTNAISISLDLAPGIYLLKTQVNGQNSDTRRLIVR